MLTLRKDLFVSMNDGFWADFWALFSSTDVVLNEFNEIAFLNALFFFPTQEGLFLSSPGDFGVVFSAEASLFSAFVSSVLFSEFSFACLNWNMRLFIDIPPMIVGISGFGCGSTAGSGNSIWKEVKTWLTGFLYLEKLITFTFNDLPIFIHYSYT